MEAYFDNSATTRCLDPVVDIVVKTMKEDYGNPSSRHGKGMESEQYLRKSREIIAQDPEGQGKRNLLHLRRHRVQ